MNELNFRLVDAFAFEPFTGNPAGVVLDASGLDDPCMQAIAREINASETTFVLPPTRSDAAVRFRWFTPGCEVSFCGHATLAGVHALIEDGRFARDMRGPAIVLPIETASGVLTVRTENQDHARAKCIYWLDMPNAALRPPRVPVQQLLPLLGRDESELDMRLPLAMTAENDVIIGFSELLSVLEMRPDFSRLGEYCEKNRLRGVLVTSLQTLSPTVACHSRFFAPAAGINEDPVTGSVHGPLAAYLVRKELVPLIDGKAGFQAAQGEPGGRTGILRIVATRDGDDVHVRVGGACVTTLRGTIIL